MTEDLFPLREQLSELSRQVNHLTQRVAQLEAATPVVSHQELPSAPVKTSRQENIGPPSEATLLVSGSSLLKHVAAICFLFVIALGLRALTDNDILGLQAGTLLGIGYASLLIGAGFALYIKASSMAPLFTATGAVLMFSVLAETYTRFSSLPVEIVYLMLAATGIALALISFHQKTALPIIIGTLGMCLTAVAIDYPDPFFPYLGLMLWLSNILGFFASRIKRCSWLRWLLMLTTHFMLQIWGLKISGIFRGTGTLEHVAPEWFVPIVTLIGFTFVMISFFGIVRSGDERISKFDFSLPAINAAWCYIAGIYALKDPALFGIPAAVAALLHFALVFWLAKRQRHNAPGTNTFTAGGVILAGLSLPALMGGVLLPLPFISLLALGICFCSNIWGSGGMRMTSCILQFSVCLVLFIEIYGTVIAQPLPALSVALICSWVALEHYRFCRRTPPPAQSIAFNRFDRFDMIALLPFFTSLSGGLIVCMALSSFILTNYYPENTALAYTGLQSLIINGAAIVMMIYAALRHNKELRNISCLIMVIGGAKVFIFDMLQISGSWLVAGIFAFGAAAALQSLILARWKPESAPAVEEQLPAA